MNLTQALDLIQNNENFKVIEKLQFKDQYNYHEPLDASVGVYLDIETTGLDPDVDEIIELALVSFTFDKNGQIYRIIDSKNYFNEPIHRDISEEITKITGITLNHVKGHKINWPEVHQIIDNCVLIVAHNASFDRPFLEKMDDLFCSKSWACSMNDIDWKNEGFESLKLEYLAYRNGFFYEGHRAEVDCRAGIELLTKPLLSQNFSAFHKLLQFARKDSYRVWAVSSAFAYKDVLKSRGYRWNDGTDGRPKSWYKDTLHEETQAELDWLNQEVYSNSFNEPICNKIDATMRYSRRF